MVNMAKKHDRILMVGQFSRFQSGYRYLFEKINKNVYGMLKKLYLYRKTAPIWGISDNLIMDLLIHEFDYVSWFIGKITSVQSHVMLNSQGFISDELAIIHNSNSLAIVEGSN